MPLKTRVGVRIREIRRERGLTQEALAEQVERSVDAISALERGLVLPGFETLERLAAVLGVSLADFFDAPADAQESDKRTQLRARLAALVQKLPDDQLALAVDQVAVLAAAATKASGR
jgi:transcriptional regulator with XRE-family HTH domain